MKRRERERHVNVKKEYREKERSEKHLRTIDGPRIL